tara:strand:- start:371 stop:1510 length:1140 start_codon:yes stop_codon:yes gene_type:complete
MSELKVNSIKGTGASTAAITIDSSSGTCTANITSNGGSQISNRNVIINGSMIVDQRNGGSSITPADANYTCDRWRYTASQASKFNVQQLSTSPPTGFLNYLKFTVASAVTVGTNDYFAIEQRIEGQNVTSRFGLGTANAKVLKLSFHVKSSLTGTFGGAIRGAGFSRTHPFSYTISSADWEKKTITIAADTGGSYSTNNTTALGVLFSLGAGSGKSGTAGAWTASDLFSATGAVSVVGTGSATFEITGVQLEEVVATDFEHKKFCEEQLLCQRYYQVIQGNSDLIMFGSGRASGTANALVAVPLSVPLRASPTINQVEYTAWGVSASNTETSTTPAVFAFRSTDTSLHMNFSNLANLTNARPAVVSCSSGSDFIMDAEL